MLLSMLTLSKNGERGPVTAKIGQFWPVFDLFWSQSPLVDSTWALRWLLNYLKSFARSLSNIFGLYTALVPPHIAHSCQKCCNLYPKNGKNGRITREFAHFLTIYISHWGGCLNYIISFFRPQFKFLGIKWCWYLCTLPIHAKIVVMYVQKMPKMATKP